MDKLVEKGYYQCFCSYSGPGTKNQASARHIGQTYYKAGDRWTPVPKQGLHFNSIRCMKCFRTVKIHVLSSTPIQSIHYIMLSKNSFELIVFWTTFLLILLSFLHQEFILFHQNRKTCFWCISIFKQHALDAQIASIARHYPGQSGQIMDYCIEA